MAEALDAGVAPICPVAEASIPTDGLVSDVEIGDEARSFESGGSCRETEKSAPNGAGEKGEGGGMRCRYSYSRKELEAMRSWSVADQRRLWQEVYNSLTRSMAESLDAGVAPICPVAEASIPTDGLVSDVEIGDEERSFESGGSCRETEKSAPNGAGEKGEDRGMRCRYSYSRKELEAMRSWSVADQRRLWEEVYKGLSEIVAGEFDGLCTSTAPKQQRGRKKKEAKKLPVVGKEISVNISQNSKLLDLSKVVLDDANVGNLNDDIPEEEWSFDYECTYNGDASSDDEHDNLHRPAFLVEGEPDFDSGPPMDGMEYLRRVRWEAAQIPKVKVANLNLSKQASKQTQYMPYIPEIEKCPSNLAPSKLWEDAFLAEFSELRKAFSHQEDSCNRFSTIGNEENSRKVPDSTQNPKSIQTVSFLRGMDAVTRASTLRKYIAIFESANELSRDDCLSLFALSVVVDAPLDADICASMRCLLRKCSSLVAGKSEPDDEVAMLNILIAIAGKYFKQSEP